MNKAITLAREAGCSETFGMDAFKFTKEELQAFYTLARADLAAEVEKLEKDAAMLRSALKDLRWAISVTPYDDCDQLSHANKLEQHKLGTECPVVPKVLAAIDKADKAMEATNGQGT